MRHRGGNASLSVEGTRTLEDLIKVALEAVPTDAALSKDFVDLSDRLRVRRREVIAAVLNAIFDHGFEPHTGASSVTVTVGAADVWSLVSEARLDFLHDQGLLDAGRPAELVLRPVGRETVDEDRGIKAARKLMIRGLALIELWQASDPHGFADRTAVQMFVAKSLDMKPGAIKTQRSNFKNNQKCSSGEQAHYTNTITMVRQMADGNAHSPFALLLPGFRALCDRAYPRVASASTSS